VVGGVEVADVPIRADQRESARGLRVGGVTVGGWRLQTRSMMFLSNSDSGRAQDQTRPVPTAR